MQYIIALFFVIYMFSMVYLRVVLFSLIISLKDPVKSGKRLFRPLPISININANARYLAGNNVSYYPSKAAALNNVHTRNYFKFVYTRRQVRLNVFVSLNAARVAFHKEEDNVFPLELFIYL